MKDINVKKTNKKLYLFLEKKRKEKNITKLEICEKLNISSSTLSEQFSRLKSGGTITTNTLFKIMLALEIEPAELFK